MDGRIRFGSADDIPEESLLRFYDQAFTERADFLKQNWRWLYQVEKENGISSPLLAIVEDKVVGHGGLFQVTLQKGDERRQAVWMTDFAILPEYQRGMLGGGLVQVGSSYCPLRVAFLNERSWGMVSKMGWQTHFQATAFQLPLRPEKLPRVQTYAQNKMGLLTASQLGGVAIRAISSALTVTASDLEQIPASSESLRPFADAGNQGFLCVPRTGDFLQWRVLTHPHLDKYFVLKSASVQVLARVMAVNDCRRLHLLTLLDESSDRRELSRFFAGVIRWALSSDIDTIVFVTSDPEIANSAGRWLPVKSKQRFAFHAENEDGWEFMSAPNQLWELLDSDFEMMFESEG